MILNWDMYEIRCDCESLHGVKLRGRIRKFAIDSDVTCLIENASDEENVVRFALMAGSNADPISNFIRSILPEAVVSESLKNVPHPVLSKLKVNDLSRYDI